VHDYNYDDILHSKLTSELVIRAILLPIIPSGDAIAEGSTRRFNIEILTHFYCEYNNIVGNTVEP
jgi:hypothetical protein